MKNNRQPEIRFPEFEDDWKQSELGDITIKIGSGKTPRGGSSVYTLSGIPFLRSQNIYNDTVNFSDVVYITESIDSDMANSRVQEGDILLNITGASIGRSAVYEYFKFANVNQHVCIIRLNQNFEPNFLQLNLTSTKGQKQIENSQAGGGREGLNFQQISKMRFFFPNNKEEQTRIGEFLKLLDKTISLQQQELTILKQTKQGFLQKMFPKEGEAVPEIRFSGFTDDWVERRLGELVVIRSGWSPSDFSESNESDGELYVKVDDLNYSQREQTNSKMKVMLHEKYSMMKKGSIIFPKRGAAIMTNKIRILGSDSYMDTNMMALETNVTNVDFLYTFIARTGLFKIADTSTIPQINNKHIESYRIALPGEKEQIQIGNFFKKLDELIELQEQELEALQQTKKAFLQKMFV